jgi:hypothetical protein
MRIRSTYRPHSPVVKVALRGPGAGDEPTARADERGPVPQRVTLLSGRRSKQVGFAAAAALGVPLVITIAVACASARLDPERNQALTFDTNGTPDAGTPLTVETPQKPAAPSQPALGDSALVPDIDAGVLQDAGAEPLRCTQEPPDPKPINTRDWVAIEFEYANGKVRVLSYRMAHSSKPRDSKRNTGRYAVELWIGCELLDRIRFNFPLQAAELPYRVGARRPLHEPPSLTARAQLRTTIFVPLSQRATRAELVDRGAGTRTSLAWPPEFPQATDAPGGAPSQGQKTR